MDVSLLGGVRRTAAFGMSDVVHPRRRKRRDVNGPPLAERLARTCSPGAPRRTTLFETPIVDREVDHIISLHELMTIREFRMLGRPDQIAVANVGENLQWLSRVVNAKHVGSHQRSWWFRTSMSGCRRFDDTFRSGK